MADVANSTTLSAKTIAANAPIPDNISLHTAIICFRMELEIYNNFDDATLENMGDAIAATYGRFMDILENWASPATSYEEAVAALKLAFEESYAFSGSLLVEPLLKAALGYFHRKH